MTKLHYILYTLTFFLFVTFFSCKDNYDNYSTSSNDILSFSVDTLSFDTLFSSIGSTTKTFMIYNKHKDPLLISSIGFLHGNRGFRINVPPERMDNEGNFIDVQINSKDSLYVFVEATLAQNSTNMPQYQTDEIIFTTNGVRQSVLLEAYGQDVVILRAKVFDESFTLSNEKPYLVYDSLTINENVTLTIPEGTTFYMQSKSWLKILGNIKATGTHQQPITFRGYRMDYLIDIPYDRVPGQWDGLWFAESSYNNEFEYVHIRNGMVAMQFESADPEILKLKLKNSVLTNVNGNLVSAENCHIIFENSELSNASGALAYLRGGKYSFTQCTLANYLPAWNGLMTTGQTVAFYNYVFDENKDKILSSLDVSFFNSIIYSSNTKAGEFSINEDDEDNAMLDYKFQNCLLLKKDGQNDGEKLIDCTFNEDPIFVKSKPEKLDQPGEYDYVFDFRPDSISPAIGKGDISIAIKLPYDINGISRLEDSGPDMGAYEWIK